MQDKIICFVGESGSGKTTITKQLEEKYNYNVIKSFTTRAPREPNEYGHTFMWFETEAELESHLASIKDKMIAYTHFDKYDYWATKDQYQGKGISIYIIDPDGVKELKKRVKDIEIIIIYFKTDKETLWERMCVRENVFDPQYLDKEFFIKREKISKRIKHDHEVFKVIECNYVVDTNRSIEEVVKTVSEILKSKINN